MSIDPLTGRTKGFCFIEFDEPAYAEAAMVMDGFELAGRKIKVGWPAKAPGAAVAAPALSVSGYPAALAVPSVAAPAPVSCCRGVDCYIVYYRRLLLFEFLLT